MASWTLVDLGRIAPEFASIDPSDFTWWANYAESQMDPSKFGDLLVAAGCNLQAHFMSSASDTPSERGMAPIRSNSVLGGSGVQVSFNVGKLPATKPFAYTRYGLEYLRLSRMVCSGGSVI